MSNVVRRNRDGLEVPSDLLSELKMTALVDQISKNDQELLEWVFVMPSLRLPINHPNAQPRYDEERLREKARDAGEPESRYIVPQEMLDAQWRLFDLMKDSFCPNCFGVRGEGFLYAPVGDKNKNIHSSTTRAPFYRDLRAFSCTVCSSGRYANTLVDRCGVTDSKALLMQDSDMWWGMEDPADRTKSRIALEAAVKAFIYRAVTVPQEGGGMTTIAGPRGCGKTTLTKWATLKVARAGKPILYVTATQLKSALEEARQDGNFSKPLLFQQCETIPHLVIDQFERVKEVTAGGAETDLAERIRDLIDARYIARDRLHTLVSLNLTKWREMGQSDALNDALDRLRDGLWAESTLTGMRASLGEQVTGEFDDQA